MPPRASRALGKETTAVQVPGVGGGGVGYSPVLAIKVCAAPKGMVFLSRFGLKTDIDFDHYGLKSGMVFKGTTRAYKRILSFQFQMNKRDREITKINHKS